MYVVKADICRIHEKVLLHFLLNVGKVISMTLYSDQIIVTVSYTQYVLTNMTIQIYFAV